MKKARIALSAIAVLAIVGTGFAFKAANNYHLRNIFLYETVSGAQGFVAAPYYKISFAGASSVVTSQITPANVYADFFYTSELPAATTTVVYTTNAQ